MEAGLPGYMRARLNRLILEGRKRATAGLLCDYEREGEPVEQPGERLALVDDDLQPVATVVVTSVSTVRFADVPWEFAQAEGEGDRTIEEWRDGHRRFWESEGIHVNDDTPVVLLLFTLDKER